DLHARHNRWPMAYADFSEAIRLRPDNPLPWIRRGSLYVDLFLGDLATLDLEKSFGLHTSSEASVWSDHALLRLNAGDTAGYYSVCARMPQQFAGWGARNSWCVARTCTMAPTTSVDPERLIAEASFAAQSDPQSLAYMFTLGAAYYRAGQFEKAI